MGRTLLLADDSVTIQKVVSLTFASEGVEIITANDGQEAMNKLAESTPDVALLDIFMPKRDGYEVCSFIKQDPRLKHIPVILLVGAFEPFDQEKARQAGADDYLTKPFQSIRQLVTKVSDLLSEEGRALQPETSERDEVIELPRDEVLTEDFSFASSNPGQRLSEIELDDPSIEVTSGTEAVAEVSPETHNFSAPEEIAAPVAFYSASLPPIVTEDSGELLELGEFEASPATLSEADDVLRIYEEIKLPEPTPVIAETVEEPAQSEIMEEAVSNTAPIEEIAAAQTLELSPQTIDAIARRVVELMSDRAVREIAWEVVPEMAELQLKRQAQERS
jgi:CheY-like chemotaxis protein